MPPGKAAKLSAAEIRLIARWIDAGAPADGAKHDPAAAIAPTHWAFRPPVKSVPPAVRAASTLRSPVDAFILAKLEAKGLTLSQEATKEKLIRRATFDLTGLPPTPADIESFLTDPSPNAYEKLLDRLLASLAYGERWGRHWLDNAGYSDIHGCDNDLGRLKENKDIWKYRDYVVRSLNADKPFDQFITEQLAGDEKCDWRSATTYTPEMLDTLVATGFLRTIPDDTDEMELNRPLERNAIVGRVTEAVASNLLGLTFQCARCHNHKYDPVTQEDYYRLLACFTPVYDPERWKLPAERCLPEISPGEVKAIADHNAAINRAIEEIKKADAIARGAAQQRASALRYSSLPESIRADVRSALAAPALKRTAVQKYLADKLGPLVQVSPAQAEQALTPAEKAVLKTVAEKAAALAAQKRSHGAFPAVSEDGTAPSETHILRRGEWSAPLARVTPGFPAALCAGGPNRAVRPRDTTGGSSGRRLALARWLTARDNPLVARVLVNRIWQHHFGIGIVATPDNFGKKGSPPSHPELLDWLAIDLVEHGWKLKRLHRLIMTSMVYRQRSERSTGNVPSRRGRRPGERAPRPHAPAPPRGRGPARCRPGLSRRLNRRIGGPPTPLDSRADGLVLVSAKDPAAAARRSLYIFARRNYFSRPARRF